MKQSNILTHFKPKSYLTIVVWLIISILAAKFIIKDAIPYFSFEKEAFGRFFNNRHILILHISCGILAMLLGPFQFWKSFRTTYPKRHRFIGRFYIIAIIIGTLCATFLAWTSGIAIHWSWAFGLQASALVWIICVLLAYRAIIQKRFQQHREWMIKSYVSTYSFVFFRLMNDAPFAEHLGNFIERGPTLGWISFAVPIFITEIILQWNKK
ncbi:DUF2306 domain-containing protein [Aestuariibaculum sediminum]|uniref:DUF2306 domain-containing protein n=1 Tax=Aestuariibaculum sediminum TaxID=2770637 RepID=A0A8J6PZ49_9FLAO|nr:DUF2306 domain-containing protein [Aestuariibaculum sediminum]MBD0831593.1 DUF2306 domain-containing protein [Aestuariibaculum sediminum]